MSISLNPIGSNHNEVELNGATLVFSYKTLVAVRCDIGRFKTNAFHSVTTSKHIGKSGLGNAEAVSPEELASIVHNIMH